MLPCPHVATLTAPHQIYTYGPRVFRFVKIEICCEFISEKRHMTDTFVPFSPPHIRVYTAPHESDALENM